MMNLDQAYSILGLQPGSNWNEIRRRHRFLVKKYHPDLIQNIEEQQIAHDEIIRINQAYAYLRKVKQRSGWDTTTKSAQSSTVDTTIQFTYQPPKEKKKSSNQSQSTSTFEPKLIDRILSAWAKNRTVRQIDRNRKRTEAFYKTEIEKQRAYWLKLRQKYDERTKLGLYRSFINAILFGRIFYDQTQNTETTLAGKFTLKDKYEIDIRHNLIQDKVFYAVNTGTNVILKYLFGGLYIVMFIYFILLRFGYHTITDTNEFIQLQLFVLSQFALLFIPDNLFQRSVLWKFRYLEKSAIKKTFANNRLPGKFSTYLQIILISKFSFLVLFITLFFTRR